MTIREVLNMSTLDALLVQARALVTAFEDADSSELRKLRDTEISRYSDVKIAEMYAIATANWLVRALDPVRPGDFPIISRPEV